MLVALEHLAMPAFPPTRRIYHPEHGKVQRRGRRPAPVALVSAVAAVAPWGEISWV